MDNGVVNFDCEQCTRPVFSFGKPEQHQNKLCLACDMIEGIPNITKQEKILMQSIMFGEDPKKLFGGY